MFTYQMFKYQVFIYMYIVQEISDTPYSGGEGVEIHCPVISETMIFTVLAKDKRGSFLASNKTFYLA